MTMNRITPEKVLPMGNWHVRLPVLVAAATMIIGLGLPAASAAQLLSPEDTARLRVYYEAIGPAVERLPAGASVPDLLRPLFQLAASRSVDKTAAAENRAALIALALYVNGKDPSRVIAEARAWRRPAWRRLPLARRRDLAQHFTLSAAIAAAAGPLAHLIGIYKEMEDARGGGGFSFTDLAADRAGTTFGEAATGVPASARRIQARVARGLVDADIMPPVDGLPADLSERDFARQYRGKNEAAFSAVLAEIDRRIAVLPVFEPSPGRPSQRRLRPTTHSVFIVVGEPQRSNQSMPSHARSNFKP